MVFIYRCSTKLPDNNPSRYIKRKKNGVKDKTIVVLIGDSITHGRVGTNYVKLLEERLGEKYEFINAGINAELAWNVLQRLDEIIKCKPDVVTILIGTNDANGAYTPENQIDHVKRMKLPRNPSREWYHEILTALVTRLKQETDARIVLLSIPTMGEIPDHPAFIQTIEFSKTIRKIAEETSCFYLPLNEKMISYLQEHPGNPKYPYEDGRKEMIKAIIRHYLFRKSWDDIAANSGFRLHIDYLHLNSFGAILIVDQIEELLDIET
jgi:lysophospholipase L1-like esterase